VSLPGADELFRSTGGLVRDRADEAASGESDDGSPDSGWGDKAAGRTAGVTELPARRVARPAGPRQPSGREKHDEKITVYVSPSELVDLEHARLILRAEHGLGIDRGRIVREALAVVLADFDAKGGESILVRRLHTAASS
jgi:hypothetical protein